MRVGEITVNGMRVGAVEINLIDDADDKEPYVGYNPSGRAEGTDTGKSFHHHGLGHSRPSGSRHQEEEKRRPGHRHGPGHYPRGEQREREQRLKHPPSTGLGDIPYSSTGNPFERSRFARELEEKPWLKEKMKHISLGENQDPRSNAAVIETMMNRAIVRGTSLEAQARRHRSSGVDEGGYYAGWAAGYSSDKSAMFDRNLSNALQGSNISNYATDNSSGGLAAREKATGSFRHHIDINRESFFSPGSAEPVLRDRWQKLHQRALDHERNKKEASTKEDLTK